MLSVFPQDVLDEIWDVIETVSEEFLTYSSLRAEGTIICSNGPYYMTNTAAKPIYGKKNFLKSSAAESSADGLETLYVAWGT